MAGKSDHLPGRPRWLAFLPDFLFELDRWPERYIAKAWLVMLVPMLPLSAAVNLLVRPEKHPEFRIDSIPTLLIFFVAGPLLETLIQAVMLAGLTRLMSAAAAAATCAVLWGLLHSTAVPTWGLVVWWPFLILSIVYLTWRQVGLVKAIGMTFALHAVHDGIILLVIVLLGYS